jgi:hypothetical membrane protein
MVNNSYACRWTLISATLAPVVLVAAWLVAGFRQPRTYNPTSQTISVLSGHAANDRWIMTAGLVVVGVCHVVTAAGLTSFRRGVRLLLACGGLGGVGVAVFAEPKYGFNSAHIVFATLCVLILALWPATIVACRWARPTAVNRRTAVTVTALFLGLAAWVFAAGHGGGGLGIAERVDTAVENAWPLVIVLAVRHRVIEPILADRRPVRCG